MASLKIQVLGKGLIPRGYGLAPHIDPFPADRTLIATIMSTPGLKVNFVNPENGKAQPLTSKNVNTIWKKYSEVVVRNEQPAPAPAETTHPHVPDMSRIPEIKEPVTPAEPAKPVTEPSKHVEAPVSKVAPTAQPQKETTPAEPAKTADVKKPEEKKDEAKKPEAATPAKADADDSLKIDRTKPADSKK